MSGQPDWAALLADRNIEGFMDEVLKVMSVWHQEAEIAKTKASDDESDTAMEVDDVPGEVTAVTSELNDVQLLDKNVPEDVADHVTHLHYSALMRARRHLRDTKQNSTGLHSLPGKLLLKIADCLEDKEKASTTPNLFTVRASVLAHLDTSTRKAYITELLSTRQFQIELWPRDDGPREDGEGSRDYFTIGCMNPLLVQGMRQSDTEKQQWFHHLKFKIDPKYLDDGLEALESPIYAEISFHVNGTRLTRPTVTLSVGQFHPWRWYNHFRVFWRVAVNSSWDRGHLRQGFNMFQVSRFIFAFKVFHREVRKDVMFERSVARSHPRVLAWMRPAVRGGGHEPADEDLMEDVSDYADAEEIEAETMSEDGGNEVGDPHGDLRFEVLGSHWSPSEVHARVLEKLAESEVRYLSLK